MDGWMDGDKGYLMTKYILTGQKQHTDKGMQRSLS